MPVAGSRPNDIANLVSQTRITQGASHFELNFRACYTDVLVEPAVRLLRESGGQAGPRLPAEAPVQQHSLPPRSTASPLVRSAQTLT